MSRKILAVTSEPISGEVIKSAVGEDVTDDAEVLVVAPALNSKLRFWTSDADPAIERAEQVAQESTERIGEQGLDVAADTGESDPLLAIQDALATFEADEIVLFTHPEGKANWSEEGLADEAKERFDVPVRQLVVE